MTKASYIANTEYDAKSNNNCCLFKVRLNPDVEKSCDAEFGIGSGSNLYC